MRPKLWLLGITGIALAGLLALVLRWQRSGYQADAIDASGPGEFGDRSASAPEQRWAPAETRGGTSADELSTAARVETSLDAIRRVWPAATEAEIRSAEGDLDRLAQLLAEKSEQPLSEVRGRLDSVLATETPNPSFPAH